MLAKLATAKTLLFGPVLDSNGAEYTGAVVGDVKICKNGGAPAALNGSATLTHKEVGLYELVLTASDVSAVGVATLVLSKTTYVAPPVHLDVLPPSIYDSLVSSTSLLPVETIRTSATGQSPQAFGRLLARCPNTVNWACISDPPSGAGNWGLSGTPGSRWFLTHGHGYRIRQTGDITSVKFYCPTMATAGTTVLKLQVWREVRSNIFDLVGETHNLVAQLVQGQLNTIPVAPIAVKEGDYIGYMVTVPVSSDYQFVANSGVTGQNSYYSNSDPGVSAVPWESKTLASGVITRIQLLGRAPHVVGIGDSIIAGHTGHYSFIEGTDSTDLDAQIPKIVAEAVGGTWQNMGAGSETTTNIAARIATDCVNLRPRIAILQGGVNDFGAGISQSTFIANWTTMLDACKAAGVEPVVCKIAPWTNGTNLQMQTRDLWNATLATLAAGYDGAVCVDFDAYVGTFRAGGDTGNLWDIAAAYSAGDGVHYNGLGYARMGQAILDALGNRLADVPVGTVAVATIPASDPGMVTGYLYCYDEDGVVQQGVVVSLKLHGLSGDGVAGDTAARGEISDAAGLVTFTNLFLGATYRLRRGSTSASKTIQIPADATSPYELEDVLGLD